LDDKDRYINWYRNFLAPILLEKPSLDLENKFIAKRSQKWGQVNFHMLKTMINDINNSKEFDSLCQQSKIIAKDVFDFSIKVLTQSSWPQNLFFTEGKFDPIFKTYMAKIENFYREKNAGRKILWCINKGDTELRRSYPSGKSYKFIMTTIQANLILSFNEASAISIGDLKARLGVAKYTHVWDELKILVKLGILKREKAVKPEEERQIPDDSEVIVINNEFTSTKLQVGCIVKQAAKRKEDVGSKVEEETFKEREFALDAAIVRIMKSRRELFLRDLQEEVKKIITLFTPEPRLVKKRLESLIERDYVIRDEANLDRLIYKP